MTTKKQLNHDIFQLIVPAVMENLLQVLAGVVITAMVGRLLADEIAAQGISNRIYQMCYAVFRGFGLGATVVVALYFGQGTIPRCKRVIEQAFITAVPLSLIFAVIIMMFPEQILRFLDDDPALISLAANYSRITACAIPFMTIISFNTAAFNGQGDTKTPMAIAITLNIVNVCLGYVLIFGVGHFEGLGITGAAIATLASQVVGAGMGLLLLYGRKGPFYRVERTGRFFSLDKVEIRALWNAGFPAAMENLFWQLSAVILSKVILSYSTNHFAAYNQAVQAEMLTEMPAQGFIVASTTLTARAVGKREGKLLRGYFKQILKMSLAVSLLTTGLLMFFPTQFMQFLTDKQELVPIGARYIFIMSFCQIPQVLSKVFNGTIRAAGNKRIPMYITFAGIWIVRVPMAVVCAWLIKTDITMVWIAILLDQTTRIILSILYVWRRRILYAVEDAEASASSGMRQSAAGK